MFIKKLLLVLALALLSISVAVAVGTAAPSKKPKASPKESTGLGAASAKPKSAPQNVTAGLKGAVKAIKGIKAIGVSTKEAKLACRVLNLLGCKEPECCKQNKCDFCTASIQVAGLAFTCAKIDNASTVTGIIFDGGLMNACPASGIA